MLELPVDLSHPANIGSNTRTLIINADGQVIRQSDYDISNKVEVVKDPTATEGSKRLWAPKGARMEAWPYAEGVADTGGNYTFPFTVPPCPGFLFEYTLRITAETPLANFNPKKDGWQAKDYSSYTHYHTCVGYGEGSIAIGLVALMTQMEARNIVASISIPITKVTFYTSAMQLHAMGNMPGVELAEQTSYDENTSQLLTISKTDLENTDIYIYRVSTGQRIAELEGLADPGGASEIDGGILTGYNGASTYRGVHENEIIATFGFTSLLLGARDFDSTGYMTRMHGQEEAKRNPWRPSETGTGGFEQKPSFLRPGEKLKLIAINRATGYTGSATMDVKSDNSALPTQISMKPPNLKVMASRDFDDKQGLNKGTPQAHHHYLIGSEGSGLTSDNYVIVKTVWLDDDGTPLPDDLPGYTGRLAISTGSGTHAVNSTNFTIAPGYNQEVVRLNNPADLVTEHFYVQVTGEPTDGTPDFSSAAGATGKLATRPSKFVPIKVPVLDEQQTAAARQALIQARRVGIANLPSEAVPVYDWVTRPEMQFSVFDFTKQELQLNTGTPGTTQTINLATTTSDDFNNLLNPDLNFAELIYSLTGPAQTELDRIGQPRQFVIALNDNGMLAQVTSDGRIRFDDNILDALNSNDYLSLRLYQLGDSANVLWQYLGNGLQIISSKEPDSQRVYSFVIVPAGVTNLLDTAGISIREQEPFKLKLYTELLPGDTFQWEISIPDTTKYGTLDIVPNSLNVNVPGGGTANSSTPAIYTWRSQASADVRYLELKFKPKEPTPRHVPVAYTKGEGCATDSAGTCNIDIAKKNPQYTYNIKVTVHSQTIGDRVYSGTIKMDHKDMIRQEYITLMGQVANISDIVRVPTRDDLISKTALQGVLNGVWSDADYEYMYERHMSLLSGLIRDGFNNQPAHTYNALPGNVATTIPSGAEQTALRLNSGWRNPERNERVRGSSTSRHMVGRAVDVGTSYDFNTTERAQLMWTLWRTAETLPATQGGLRFRWLLEDADASSNTTSTSYSPYGTYLVQSGTPTGDTVQVVPLDDNRGATLGSPRDGIPDYFNYASHLHGETKPERCGGWDCE